MLTVLSWAALVTCSAVGTAADSSGSRYRFENLGAPLKTKPVRVQFVTRDRAGRFAAWGVIESPGRNGVFAVYTDNGESIWLDLAKYGVVHISIHRASNDCVYIYVGKPGRFLKYDINTRETTDLGVPSKETNYTLGHAIGPDGKFYIGSYPTTQLIRVDPATDKVEDLGRVTDDPSQQYILYPAVSDDNVVYCPVGLHHPELWAYDLDTGAKRQILPEDMVDRQKMRCPLARLAPDGQVYGYGAGRMFLCKPDGVEYVEPYQGRHWSANHRLPPDARNAGPYRCLMITTPGKLHMKHVETGEKRLVDTDIDGASVAIWTVCCERDGKIYGGGLKPANTFVFDIETGRMEDLGCLGAGSIEVYDILSHPRGLFQSSYMGGCLDLFDPSKPIERGKNPRPIAKLSEGYEQERLEQLVLGPDGMIYTGATPIKGHLGGALARIDPDDLTVKVWRNVVPNQSLPALAAVPRTGEVFVTTTIAGGSSAIPTEKEAFVFLWDCAKEAISWQGQPVPGATRYGKVVLARNGLLYGLADLPEKDKHYYAFDPVKRETVHSAKFPVPYVRWQGLADRPIGPDGLICGLAAGCVFAIDPSDHSVKAIARHESIHGHLGTLYATDDGVLYYGTDADLWCVDLKLAKATAED